MDIEFLGNGIVLLFMKYYIDYFIASFGKALGVKLSSPAKKGLKNINKISPSLDKKEADTLHDIATKILWVAKKRDLTLNQ